MTIEAKEFKKWGYTFTRIESEDGKAGVRIKRDDDDYGSVDVIDFSSNPPFQVSIDGEVGIDRYEEEIFSNLARLQEIRKELGIEVNFQVEIKS